MRFASKSFASDEFERGRRIGRDEERVLIARKLHQGFECLTAASFAVELAKEQSERQGELVSKASKLLDEAAHLLGEVLKDKKDDTPRRRPALEQPPKTPTNSLGFTNFHRTKPALDE
jgi:hypothetical protein